MMMMVMMMMEMLSQTNFTGMHSFHLPHRPYKIAPNFMSGIRYVNFANQDKVRILSIGL